MHIPDAIIEAYAQCYDDLVSPGVGDILREAWRQVRPLYVPCGCPLDPHHRWNCPATPIWAQTMRDLDTNPWTVLSGCLAWNDMQLGGDA